MCKLIGLVYRHTDDEVLCILFHRKKYNKSTKQIRLVTNRGHLLRTSNNICY